MKLFKFHFHKWEYYRQPHRFYIPEPPVFQERYRKCSICGKVQRRPEGHLFYETLTGIKKEIFEGCFRAGFMERVK